MKIESRLTVDVLNRVEVCALENDEPSAENVRFINAVVFAARCAANCGFVGLGTSVQCKLPLHTQGPKLIQHRVIDDCVTGGCPRKKLWHDVAMDEAESLQVAEPANDIIQEESHLFI